MNLSRVVLGVGAAVILALGIVGLILGLDGHDRPDWLVTVGGFAIVAGVVFAIISVKDPTIGKTLRSTARDRATTHTISFSVGERETHEVGFSFDQTWGWLVVTVDDIVVAKKLVTLSARLVTAIDISVGDDEVHAVRLEKHRPLAMSFARHQPLKGFVDGTLVVES